MKKLICLVCLAMSVMVGSVSAQSIKSQDAITDDYLPLLQASGYRVYSFDISEFLDESYFFNFQIREYVNKEEVEGKYRNFMFPNRVMLAEMPESSQKSILQEGRAADPENGVYIQSKKLTIGFRPAKEDSVQFVRLSLDGLGESGMPLELKPLKKSENDKQFYYYESRPFKIEKFEEGKFIPLVFFASYWYDEKGGFFRFCGADEIGPNMEADYVENTPHFYVIGVEIKKK